MQGKPGAWTSRTARSSSSGRASCPGAERQPRQAAYERGRTKRPRCSDDHHLEVVLGHPAVGAGPGVWNVFPARARRDAFLRQPEGLVVDEAADDAHPGAVGGAWLVHRIMRWWLRTRRGPPLSHPASRQETTP